MRTDAKAPTVLLGTILGFGFVGAVLGVLHANHIVQAIADGVRRTNPADPLDTVLFLWFGYIVAYLLGGLIVGTVVALWRARANSASPR